jgi:hypothetical protein
MAGNQVLEWTDLDTEIKTALLKNVRVSFNDIRYALLRERSNQDPLAPPDL